MADSSESRPVARATKPVSEALLNEKWDRAISSMIIKSSLGLSFGVVFSVLLFKRRAWPAWVGLGFGAGRAWEESDGMFTSYTFYVVAGGCFNFIIGCVASSRTASELESGSKVVEHVLRSLACPRHITFTQSLETLTNICKASFRRGDSPVRDALRR
ncbi:hypothetical protein PENSTE_c035G06227 [Penicillium steckii]|uniref:MICOS complex subunit MIC10 n=1 Tax=Penicillium steckii TaxID=303698 RepID=A0A1V6SLD1_9EURO|nr:hypothetical protein PENSTE_c035G06227 [Penicillium steckii]